MGKTAPAISVSEFRAVFPEFSDTVKYPDALVDYRLDMAKNFVGYSRWGNSYKHGCYLYTAHFCALALRAQSGNSSGANVTSKSADGLSVTYDFASNSETGAGQWNATIYGREFYRLTLIFGMGAIQL